MKCRILYPMSEQRLLGGNKQKNMETHVLIIAEMKVPHGRLQFALRGTT
jgi:hypothetical protein